MEQYKKLSGLYHDKWGERLIKPYLHIIDAMTKKYSVKGKVVLDIACGTGNLLGRLFQNGYICFGTDLSKDMITEAKNRYPDIHFFVQNMKNVALDKNFDLVLNTFNSANYLLEIIELDGMFKSVHDLLSADGVFIVDFSTHNLYTINFEGEHMQNINGVDFKQICTYDRIKNIATSQFIFSDSGVEIHQQKAFALEDIEKSIDKSKLTIVEMFGDFDLSPLTNESLRYVFVLKKPSRYSSGFRHILFPQSLQKTFAVLRSVAGT